ncbi:MAG TPA: GtrA family protein [Blastococcus sp.]|nr:GtrA family protein [Blastococcus sp.]
MTAYLPAEPRSTGAEMAEAVVAGVRGRNETVDAVGPAAGQERIGGYAAVGLAPAAVVPPPAPDRQRAGELGREASGFAAVGAFGLLVDVGGYNALVHLGGTGLLDDQPLVAKAVSLVAGTTVAYVGNRFWTYRDRPRGRLAREYVLYMALSAVALGIALGCLAVSRYVLGLSSPMADNIAANGIGLALGSMFRFLTYRRFVFPEEPTS